MRTTIDLPDELYRTLKARACLTGVTLRQLIQRLIEQSLRSSAPSTPHAQRHAPPLIIPARGVPIPALSRADLARLEEEEDEVKHARLA
jgi:hypothetical protein